jgi:SAM-dependent methyltransferase
MANSLFRKSTHQALAKLIINGKILDVGGDTRSPYQKLLRGTHQFTNLNLDVAAGPNIRHNLENCPWPVSDEQFDAILLINVLEHIFNFTAVIHESWRVIKPGGKIVIVVPFLHQIHPSPHDYFRYTAETLERLFSEYRFVDLEIKTLGAGAWGVAYNLLQRFFPWPFNWLFERAAVSLDYGLRQLAWWRGKKYTGQEYPLGYILTAHRK